MQILWLRKKTFSVMFAALLAGGYSATGLAQQGQNLIKLRQIVNVEANSIPFIVAYEEGIYKKNGLDVDQCISAGGVQQRSGSGFNIPSQHVCAVPTGQAAVNEELNPGSANAGPFSIGGGGPTVVREMKEGRLGSGIILANFDPVTNWSIVARKDITKPEDLKGKRIGITGYSNINGFMTLLFAQMMGWDPKHGDINIVYGQRELENIRKGDVDAAMVVAMVAITAKAEGYSTVVDLRDWKVPMIGNALHVDRTWYQKNRDTARKMVKSMVEAIALIKNDRQAAYRSMSSWYGWNDPPKQAELYTYLTEIPNKPYPTVEQISRYLKVYFPDEPWPIEPRAFFDDTLLRELDTSGYIDSLYKK